MGATPVAAGSLGDAYYARQTNLDNMADAFGKNQLQQSNDYYQTMASNVNGGSWGSHMNNFTIRGAQLGNVDQQQAIDTRAINFDAIQRRLQLDQQTSLDPLTYQERQGNFAAQLGQQAHQFDASQAFNYAQLAENQRQFNNPRGGAGGSMNGYSQGWGPYGGFYSAPRFA